MQTLNPACRQASVQYVPFISGHPSGEPLLLACDPVWQAYRPAANEKIGASPTALAAFARIAKSRPRDAIERPRFCFAAVRKRKTG